MLISGRRLWDFLSSSNSVKKRQLRSFRRWDVSFHWRKAVLSIFKINKLKNLNFTVLMAYRTLRITWFHEFRQKLFPLETWIWLLGPKEMLYCKHLFLLHSCLCQSTQSVAVRKILSPVSVARQECQGVLPSLLWAEVHTSTCTYSYLLTGTVQVLCTSDANFLQLFPGFTTSPRTEIRTWPKL